MTNSYDLRRKMIRDAVRYLACARRWRLRGNSYAAALYLHKAVAITRDLLAARNLRPGAFMETFGPRA